MNLTLQGCSLKKNQSIIIESLLVEVRMKDPESYLGVPQSLTWEFQKTQLEKNIQEWMDYEANHVWRATKNR